MQRQFIYLPLKPQQPALAPDGQNQREPQLVPLKQPLHVVEPLNDAPLNRVPHVVETPHQLVAAPPYLKPPLKHRKQLQKPPPFVLYVPPKETPTPHANTRQAA